MRLEWQLAAMIGVLIWQTAGYAGRSVPPPKGTGGFTRKLISTAERTIINFKVREIIKIARVTVDMQSNMIHALAPRAGRARVSVGKGRATTTRPAFYL